MKTIDHTLCVAPMMNHTDRHFRYFLRLLSPQVMLYTEMITTGAILNTDVNKILKFDNCEHPVGIQLGGSDPEQLSQCAKIAEDFGYDEINLNIGCPSDRVQSAKFGACLMAEPDLVAESVTAMQNNVNIPVTVKSRIGIDHMNSYEAFRHFIEQIKTSGCKTFFVHARKAWLQGLSPRQNREIPPLKYDYVHRLKQDYPELEIVINGGFLSIDDVIDQLDHVDGVMLGRVICNNPFILSEANGWIFNDASHTITRSEAISQYMDYVEKQMADGESLGHLGRHIFGIFQGQRGARAFRRYLSHNIHKSGSGVEVIRQAMDLVE